MSNPIAKKSLRNRFSAHSVKQFDLITSDSELTISATGTQWGKSIAGARWMFRQILKSKNPSDKYILMAPTYKIMAQSMQPYFLNLMKGLGKHYKTDSYFQMRNGRTIYFRTETDPDSIVGIPDVRAYWLDEAGKVSLYFHENIKARAASVGALGLYTTSPYSRNWLYRDYIKEKEKGKLPDLKLIRAASWENPFHTLANPLARAKMLSEMDPRRFEMLFGGQWGKQAGLVYDCFEEATNICPSQRLPNGTVYYGGIDWGHTEPFVLIVRAVTPDNQHFQVSEFYKTGLTIIQQIQVAKSKLATFGIRQFFCGHERPENILLFNQNGLPAIGVPESNIQAGTDLHYELIKTRRYKVFEGTSPYTIDEYETYHYPETKDLGEDDDAKDETPVGQSDHCMSANRFVTLRTFLKSTRYQPYTPVGSQQAVRNETQEARLRRLQRAPLRHH